MRIEVKYMRRNPIKNQTGSPQLTDLQRLDDQIEVRARQMAAVLEISHKLVALEEKPLLDLILNRLEAAVGYTFAAITSVEAEQLTILAYRGPALTEQVVGRRFSVTNLEAVHQRRESPEFFVDEPPAQLYDPITEIIETVTNKATDRRLNYNPVWLVLPLNFRKQTIGFFCLDHNRAGRYDPQELELILAFANYAALAIGNNRLHQQARNLAILEERSRLGQELHDNLAQILVFLKLKVIATNVLLAAGQLDQAQANLQELKQLISETYTDVREEIFNLQAKITSGLSFSEVLYKYIAKYKRFYGLNIQLVVEDESLLEFPIDVGIQVIRVIQEALINVRKHAGVDQARLSFTRAGGQLQIRIEDEGQGFNAEQLQQSGQSGFGLGIMRERAESIGGTLEVESRPGYGVWIIMRLPIAEKPFREPAAGPRNNQDYLLVQH